MVTVEEAERIILGSSRNYGNEVLPLADCLGRVLAAPIVADRDLPPFDRVTMDGIAVRYASFQSGIRTFRIKATQAAGEAPIQIEADDECVEIMTGAALSSSADTVVPYEQIAIVHGIATLKTDQISVRQHIHPQGKDKKQHEALVRAGALISPAVIAVASAVGSTTLSVRKHPRTVIISTGDELVDIGDTPETFQVRRSNNYAINAELKKIGIASDMRHLPDSPDVLANKLQQCLRDYDVILMSGGVSMGKFDFVPQALDQLQVKKRFHKVRQRPGKPFWFGEHGDGALVFAFPGNPVSTFLCFHRYFVPWLKASWGIGSNPPAAILAEDFSFRAPLQYFLQVKLDIDPRGQLMASPIEGHGSGDFANLLSTDAFLELPLEQEEFKQGEVFPAWIFRQTL